MRELCIDRVFAVLFHLLDHVRWEDDHFGACVADHAFAHLAVKDDTDPNFARALLRVQRQPSLSCLPEQNC